jgi:mediator of RNA polymerase II transcription subunit 5
LLPSLVSGLGWAARKLWESRGDSPYLDQLFILLSCLVKPPSLSAEAKSLHETVLAITAVQLERALAHIQKFNVKRKEVESLFNVLRPHLQAPRNGTATRSELEGWSTQSHGGLLTALKHSYHNLVSWSNRLFTAQQATDNSSNGGTHANVGSAPQYTHRLIMTCILVNGAPKTLSLLLVESTKMITSGSCTPDVPLDVLTAIICAPSVQPARFTSTLRQALQSAQAEAYTLSVGKNGEGADTVRAELIVRLSRRVEAQSPVRPVPQPAPEQSQAENVVATADIIMGLEGNETADTNMPDAGIDATNSNDMLEGMLKDVDSADLDSLMDTGGDDLFNLA